MEITIVVLFFVFFLHNGIMPQTHFQSHNARHTFHAAVWRKLKNLLLKSDNMRFWVSFFEMDVGVIRLGVDNFCIKHFIDFMLVANFSSVEMAPPSADIYADTFIMARLRRGILSVDCWSLQYSTFRYFGQHIACIMQIW